MTSKILLLASGFALASVVGLLPFSAAAEVVNCNQNPNASIQDAVDNADGPTTIDIMGLCVGDVTITKDDITLSGRPGQSPCNKANPGGNGTIVEFKDAAAYAMLRMIRRYAY